MRLTFSLLLLTAFLLTACGRQSTGGQSTPEAISTATTQPTLAPTYTAISLPPTSTPTLARPTPAAQVTFPPEFDYEDGSAVLLTRRNYHKELLCP